MPGTPRSPRASVTPLAALAPAIATLLAVTVLTALPAEAVCCGCVAASNANHASTRRRQAPVWINELERAGVPGLQAQTEQLSNHARLQMEQAERIADAREQAASRRQRKLLRATAESDGRHAPDPNGCLTLERAGWPGYGPAPEASAPQSAAAARSEGSPRSATDRRRHRAELADRGVSTTDVSQYPAPATLPRSSERATGARTLVQNRIDPLPAPALDNAHVRLPRGAVLDAELDQVRAQQSLVRETAGYLFGLREGQTAPDGTAIRAGESMGKFVEKAPYFTPLPRGAVSEMQSLDERLGNDEPLTVARLMIADKATECQRQNPRRQIAASRWPDQETAEADRPVDAGTVGPGLPPDPRVTDAQVPGENTRPPSQPWAEETRYLTCRPTCRTAPRGCSAASMVWRISRWCGSSTRTSDRS